MPAASALASHAYLVGSQAYHADCVRLGAKVGALDVQA